MATKKQVDELIKYSLNNDKEKVFQIAKEIAEKDNNIEMIDKINHIFYIHKHANSSIKGGSNVDVTLLPEKNYQEYLYDIQYPHYTLDNITLPNETKIKIQNWIKELENLKYLSSFNLPLQTKAIFYGETGLGKTMTAYAIANAINKPLLLMNLSSIISSKLGETSKNLSFVFQVAKERGAVIYLDEIDFIANKRDSNQDHSEIRRSMLALMQILDLIPADLIVIASTNMMESLDPAIKRRFGIRIEFSAPNEDLINKFIEYLSEVYSFKIDNNNLKKITKYLLGRNYSDIKHIILSSYKNKLLHDNSKSKDMDLSFSDIKLHQSIE